MDAAPLVPKKLFTAWKPVAAAGICGLLLVVGAARSPAALTTLLPAAPKPVFTCDVAASNVCATLPADADAAFCDERDARAGSVSRLRPRAASFVRRDPAPAARAARLVSFLEKTRFEAARRFRNPEGASRFAGIRMPRIQLGSNPRPLVAYPVDRYSETIDNLDARPAAKACCAACVGRRRRRERRLREHVGSE